MSLESQAEEKAPLFPNGKLDLSNPEEQLIEAFYKAKTALRRYIPSEGAEWKTEQSVLAAEKTRQQIQQKKSAIQSALTAGVDLPVESAISMNAEESRQYYLGKFMSSAYGMGAYPANLGKKAIQAGIMTESQYLDGIKVRLQGFSDIIYAGETAHLGSLVNAEKVADGKPGQIIVSSNGSTVVTGGDASGLGELATGTVILIGIVVVALAAGITVWAIKTHEINQTMDIMSRHCNDAVQRGDKDAIRWCRDFFEESKEVGEPGIVSTLFGDRGMDVFLKYAAILGGGYLALVFMPQIADAMLSTKRVMREHKERESR